MLFQDGWRLLFDVGIFHGKVEHGSGPGSMSLPIGRGVREVGVGGRYGALLKFGATDLIWLTL